MQPQKIVEVPPLKEPKLIWKFGNWPHMQLQPFLIDKKKYSYVWNESDEYNLSNVTHMDG